MNTLERLDNTDAAIALEGSGAREGRSLHLSERLARAQYLLVAMVFMQFVWLSAIWLTGTASNTSKLLHLAIYTLLMGVFVSRMPVGLISGLGGLKEQAPDRVYRLWQRFWESCFQRYFELRPCSPSDLRPWQAVTAAASLCWEGNRMTTEPRVSLVHAALNGEEHPWLYRRKRSTTIASV